MLKVSLRNITIAIVSFFTFILGVENVLYVWQSTATDLEPFVIQQKLFKWFPLLPWMERGDYDFHLRHHKVSPHHPDIVVIQINERSLQKIGQFPFARSEYGKLIHRLEKAKAKVLAFDITFPEFERNDALSEFKRFESEIVATKGNENILARLRDRMGNINGDDDFAQVLKSTTLPLVLGFANTLNEEGEEGLHSLGKKSQSYLRDHSLTSSQINSNAFRNSLSGIIPIFPNEKILAALKPQSLGSFAIDPDEDSVIRQASMVTEYNGGYFPSLSLAAVSKYLNTPLKILRDGGLWVRDEAGKVNIPLDQNGFLPIRYYGESKVFPYYEFIDVLEGKHDKDLNGKIVFLGVTSVGLKDIRATPFVKDYPGVGVHATLASNILNESFLEKDQRYYNWAFLFLILGGCLVSYIVHRLHPLTSLLMTVLAITVTQAVGRYFFNQGVVIPTMIPSLELLTLLFTGVLYRYFSEEKEKRFVRTAFSRYVSGAVVAEILKDQSKLRLGGQKRELSVMFCDMKGFTKFSEGMDAEFLTQVLNQFFTRMTAVVLKNKGTLDKYIGDAIMCFWGAPLDLPNHAELTCRAALEMMEELDRINQEWTQKYGFSVGVRIGINSGEMFVGNMGSDQVFSYTVMGDNVNLGSRVEGVNNIYGTSVIVCSNTAERVKDFFHLRPLDRVQVKGKENAVDIFELVCVRNGPQPEWIHAFEQGRERYIEGNWIEAEAAFRTCITLRSGDTPSQVFLDRIAELKKSKNSDWNGVWRLEAK